MNSRTSTNRIIWLLMLASLLLCFFNNFTCAPTPVRLIYSGTMVFSLVLFPFHVIKNNDYGKTTNRILCFILVFSFVAVCHSALSDNNVHTGNKWVTMFGNPECLFMMLAPFYAYLGSVSNSIIILKRALQVFLLVGVIGLVSLKFIPLNVLCFSIVFFPYLSKKYQIIIILSIFMGVYSAFFAEDTSRTTAISILFAMLSFVLVYLVRNSMMIKIVCYTSVFIPLGYAIYTLCNPDFSIFEYVLDIVMQKTGDSQMSTDTRSFLFRELGEDMTQNNAWLFGKGALSHYYSFYFSKASGDSENRIGCEVTFLQCLLRGGLTYTFCYFSLIIFAIHNALTYSKNKFLLSVAVMASGWVLIACMSYLNGFEFKHLGFFILVGCCLSSKILEKSDEDINNMLR